MLYDFALPVPADRKETAPVEAEAKLTHGVITHVWVQFPPGCHGMVYTYIRRGLHQVWPTNPDSKFCADDYVIDWDEYYELFEEPFSFIVGGYSPGTTYSHEITFRFEVTPQELAERGMEQMGIIERIGRLLGIKR